MKRLLGLLALSAALLAPAAVPAADQAADVKGTSPEATTIVTLLKWGRDNKDAYALLTAYKMIAKLPPGTEDKSKAAEDKDAKNVDVDAAVILDEAAKYANGDAQLLDQIKKARKELPTKRGCWYRWYCNAWGYCWYRWWCM